MKKKGVDDALIQPYSGHDSRQSLEIYSKLSLGDCQPEYEKKIKDFPVWSYNVPNALVLNTGPENKNKDSDNSSSDAIINDVK